MDLQPGQIKEYFKGKFIPDSVRFAERLHHIKAFVFDWDGVFNNGFKSDAGSSPFNEIDAMGVNLLRFSHYLKTGEQAITAVISGESNGGAITLAKRENYNALYFHIKKKVDALRHLCDAEGIRENQVCFVFDDVLDLSASKVAGLRIMVPHGAGLLLQQYVLDHELVDYITEAWGHQQAVREICELIMCVSGNYTTVMDHRVAFSETYQQFTKQRKEIKTRFLKADLSGPIEEVNP